MAITRQGVTTTHIYDAMEEQALRIQSVDMALQLLGTGSEVDTLITTAEKILGFITTETKEDSSIAGTDSGTDTGKGVPKSGLVHFAS